MAQPIFFQTVTITTAQMAMLESVSQFGWGSPNNPSTWLIGPNAIKHPGPNNGHGDHRRNPRANIALKKLHTSAADSTTPQQKLKNRRNDLQRKIKL